MPITEVVIVTYNRLDLLRECVSAVQNQTVPFSKIIIVNNASTDGTSEYLEAFQENPLYRIIHMEKNVGGAGGFYEGMASTKADEMDYLLIIDDDAILEPDYMEKLLQYASKYPDHAALAGAVYTDGQIDTNQRRRLGWKLLFLEKSIPVEEYQKQSFTCDLATFCGLLVNVKAMRHIGLPHKSYFLWYDDTEYCLRLGEFQSRRFPGLEELLMDANTNQMKSGYDGVTVIPEAILHHKTTLPAKEQGLLDRTSWRQYYGYRNRLDTAKQHFGVLSGVCIVLEYSLLILISLICLLIPGKREHAKFNVRMIRDARHDGWTGRLGYSEKYSRG